MANQTQRPRRIQRAPKPETIDRIQRQMPVLTSDDFPTPSGANSGSRHLHSVGELVGNLDWK